MSGKRFRALVVREKYPGVFDRKIEEKSVDDLPPGDVLIRVMYSSLNYKDALSATGNRGVTRKFPHTPGVDAAGIVEESRDARFKPGDDVLVTGYDLGMNTSGGFGQYVRVPAGWVVRMPHGLTLAESMAYGTAGFTAALSVWRLIEAGIETSRGNVVVTGATGGVGSFAVAILAKAGYKVSAATGKMEEKDYLQTLGASEVIHRDEVNDDSGRALLHSRWASGVDTVGGNVLATLLKTTQFGGVVTCCGNVLGGDLNTTVYPFILNAVGLLGVASAECPMDIRLDVWKKIAGPWKLDHLDMITGEIPLDSVDAEIDRILSGGHRGRKVIRMAQ